MRGPFTINGERVEMFVPLMKFDERTGEFAGWSSVEEPDGHGEICDIEKSWPAIISDAKSQFEISGGKSVGVLRRQHDRTKSIGKLTLIERRERDGKPGIWVEGLCTDEKAKADAALGVLTGISIRGLAQKWPDETVKGLTRYAWKMREEDSLVDRPAVPHALIEVMKSNGVAEMVKARGRDVAQFWSCGIAGCPNQHTAKVDAQTCDGTKSANRSGDLRKSLYGIADLVSLLSTLLCITSNVEYEETWEAINQGDTSGLPIAQQLKEIAQKVFDALEAMIADERRELDEEMTPEMAMSAAMRTLKTSSTAKQLFKSLRVPSSNGSNPQPKTAKEVTMTAEEIQKAAGDHIRATLTPLAKALGVDEKSADMFGDMAKAFEKSAAASTASAAKVDEIEKGLDIAAGAIATLSKGLAQTLVRVTGVKVKDTSDLAEVLKAIDDKPADPKAALRVVPVSKSVDTGGEQPADKPKTELEAYSLANRQRLA